MLIVAAAMVDADGRVLLQRRPEGKPMAGLWEFPGGKVDPGELPEAALVRELDEELGIAVDAGALSPAAFASAGVGDRHMILLLYILREWRGEPAALHASDLVWVRPGEMYTFEMPPADLPLIPILEALLQASGDQPER